MTDIDNDGYIDLIISAENYNEDYKPQNYINWNNGGDGTDDNRLILPSQEKPSDVGNYGHETTDYCFNDIDGDGNVKIIGSATWSGPQSQPKFST
jgi:hypothetical protein